MTVSVAVVYADVPGFPVGTSVSAVKVTITDTSGNATSQSVAPGTNSVSFENVAAGDYLMSVQALDQNGVGLGTAVTGSFNVPAPSTITLSLPQSATASVA